MSAEAKSKGGKKRLSRSKHGTLHELNITPLLDLVMVLLVIFMITTPQLSNDLNLNLPSNTPPPPGKKPEIYKIDIGDNGELALNGRAVTVAELPQLFESIKQRYPATNPPPFVIRGTDKVVYERVIAVMDLLQQSDINKVGLDTAYH